MKKIFKHLIPFLTALIITVSASPVWSAPMQGSGGITSALQGTRVSAFAPLPSLDETRISDFRSGHGFVKQSAAGTQTDDTTTHLNGTQSLKITTDGDGVAVASDLGSLTLDFTGKSLFLICKTSDIANTTEITVYLTGDNFATFYIVPFDDATTNYFIDGEWTILTMNFGDWATSGSPTRSSITKIRLRVKDNGSAAVSVNYAAIGTVPEPSGGALSFTFDDGWLSQYEEAKKKMSQYGFPATAYVIKANLGLSGFMTIAQMHELEDIHRWEIGAHHGTNLTTVSLADAEARIKSEKQWLFDNGFSRGTDHFAIPNGAFNANLLALFKKYFRTVRTIAKTAETFPPADWNRLRILNVTNIVTPATVATAVDNARVNKSWLILLFHKIVASPTVSTEYSITNFGTIVDDIASDGIAVKTISQAIVTQ